MNSGKSSRPSSLKCAISSLSNRTFSGVLAFVRAWSVPFSLHLTFTRHTFSLEKEHQDPRRMFRPIQFLRSLMENSTTNNTYAEASRWHLIYNLKVLHWRIPSLWCTIHDQAKELLDHPSELVRTRISS